MLVLNFFQEYKNYVITKMRVHIYHFYHKYNGIQTSFVRNI